MVGKGEYSKNYFVRMIFPVFASIVALKGMPTKENPLKLEVIKVPAEVKGHEYLKVKIAK